LLCLLAYQALQSCKVIATIREVTYKLLDLYWSVFIYTILKFIEQVKKIVNKSFARSNPRIVFTTVLAV